MITWFAEWEQKEFYLFIYIYSVSSMFPHIYISLSRELGESLENLSSHQFSSVFNYLKNLDTFESAKPVVFFHNQLFCINIPDQKQLCFINPQHFEIFVEKKPMLERAQNMPCGVLQGSTFIKYFLWHFILLMNTI